MIAIIIQARMGSSRLPGKIMLNLAGKPILWHVVTRCEHSKFADKVIVATTTRKEDDVIEEFCQKNNILCFRGDSENVLSRYYEAAKKYGADIIVRVTSDCPLVDPQIIDLCIDSLVKNKYDYISNANPGKRMFPRGLDVEVFSFEALEKTHKLAAEDYQKEHVTPFIWENKNKNFVVGPVITAPPPYQGNFRLTVDYPKDLELIKKIYKKFHRPGKIINTMWVVAFLHKNPKIAAINSHLKQKPLK